jgi:hypothetical protein
VGHLQIPSSSLSSSNGRKQGSYGELQHTCNLNDPTTSVLSLLVLIYSRLILCRADIKQSRILDARSLVINAFSNTGYLESSDFSQRNIAIVFDMNGTIIPPALSFRFISYCLCIWGVKTIDILFQDNSFPIHYVP